MHLLLTVFEDEWWSERQEDVSSALHMWSDWRDFLWLPLRRMWYLMYLFACFQRSFTKAVQRLLSALQASAGRTVDCGPGLCMVPRPVISFTRWTSLDVAKHLTFHSSLNQADDQEQVQTAHIMQTFYKAVFHSSLTLCMFVYLQSFFMWYGWAENHSVDKTIS